MLRRYSTLPRVSSHSRAAASGSKDPPRVAETSVVGVVARQRLQLKPVEPARLPHLLYRRGNRFTITNGEHHLGPAALDDLMHNKYRQVVEQRRIVDTHHHRGAR